MKEVEYMAYEKMIEKTKEFIEKCKEFSDILDSMDTLSCNLGTNVPVEIDAKTKDWRIFESRTETFFEVNNFPPKMSEYAEKYQNILQSNKSGGITSQTIDDLIVLFNEIIDYLNICEEKTSFKDSTTLGSVTEKKRKIFISHNSYDQEYCKALVLFIHNLGISQDCIVCTSLDGYGPRVDDDIYPWLRKQFDYDIHVLFMLSKAYYNSVPSLNEMGAAWVLQQKYTSLILPGFDFNMIRGAVNPQKIAINLTLEERALRSRLKQFSENICKEFGKPEPNSDQWNLLADSFIDSIKNINEKYDPDGFENKATKEVEKSGAFVNFNKANLMALSFADENIKLSHCALVLLAYISRDSRAEVLEYSDVRGHHITTGKWDFIGLDSNPRNEVVWTEALETLIHYGYLKKISNKDNIYKLTGKGFVVADTVIEENEINVSVSPGFYLATS